MAEQIISVDRMEQAVSLFGSFDENVRLIEKEFSVSVVSRGSDLKVTGDDENVMKGVRAVNGLLTLINRGETLSDQNVRYVLNLVNEGNEDKIEQMASDCICISAKGKPVKPKTLGQKKYIEINIYKSAYRACHLIHKTTWFSKVYIFSILSHFSYFCGVN